MRLAAVYIPENTLPHIFGEQHSEITLNFGGLNYYNFSKKGTEIELDIVTVNEKFIEEFWDKNISLVSSIVGKNATGKTSILRAFNNDIDSGSRKIVFLFETEVKEKYIILNKTKYTIKSNIDNAVIEFCKSFERLFYSPNLDFDLRDTFSPISPVNSFSDTLENYFLDSVRRNVNFLSDTIVEDIKVVYDDFPSYEYIKINASKLRKSKIRTPYLESNFGNPHRGDALKNELSGDINRLKSPDFEKNEFSKEELIRIFEANIQKLNSESFTEQFNKIWDLEDYKYNDPDGYDYIHNASNLLKNTEVNILSYLLLGATFAQTGIGGGLDFSEISKTTDFYGRIDLLLETYLVNEYKLLTEEIKKKLGGVRVKDWEKIINLIEKDKFSKLSGVDIIPIKNRMITYSNSFAEILMFYQDLVKISSSKEVGLKNGDLIFDIKNPESKLLFDEFIYKYQFILNSFPKCPITISLFDFSPNKKLSTGEKSILDFFSSLYNHIDVSKESEHLNYEYYLLLLDEPDLGFHPLWKKKFINAISKTLPILFSKITPKKFDESSKQYIKLMDNPIVQIIFTTHDPLTLSDIPNQNIIYIDKSDNSSFVLDNFDRPQKSFGANITNLLSDSFFISDGLIGDFAKQKIEETIKWIDKQKNTSKRDKNFQNELEHHKKIVSIIDEKIIKLKLSEMIAEVEGNNDFQKKMYDDEIAYLINKRQNLN